MIIRLEDLDNVEGIEFIPKDEIEFDEGIAAVETIRAGKELTIPEMLAQKFKASLNQIGKPFMRDEDNESFIPLRKLYATALRYELENHDPMSDPKFVTLKENVGLGMEIYYYENVVVPQLSDKIHDLFFVDMKNEYLYNFVDRDSSYSIGGMNGDYGLMRWENRISDAITPSGKNKSFGMSDKKMVEIFENSGMAELFKATWVTDYDARIPIIFSRLALDGIEKSVKSFNKMTTLTSDILEDI